MSTREMLKSEIDYMPETALTAITEFFAILRNYTKIDDKNRCEAGYDLLMKNCKKIDPPIDYDKEKLEYFDEKYGSTN
jgi:hypothetical protein